MRTMTETAKKKRGMPSSFTIRLLLLASVAVITVVISGTSGGAATVRLGAGCGGLGSTVHPFAVGAAVDALTGVGIEVNQTNIIGLGLVLSAVTTLISIAFVMNYAKKVKSDMGSTILSMQELKDAEEAHGAAAADVTKDVKLTGRQKAVG